MIKVVSLAMYIVLVCAVITGCGATHSPQPVSAVHIPAELTQLIQSNRESIFAPANPDALKTFKGYLTTGLDTKTDAIIAGGVLQEKSEKNAIVPKTLTHEQILSELDYLFNLLKYGYGGYTYAGGDLVFDSLKQEMEAKLERMDNSVKTDDYLSELLAPYLRNVITDNHFYISDNTSGLSAGIGASIKTFYSCEAVYFTKNDVGDYITTIKNKKYKLVSDGAVSCILPTIDPKGNFAWFFGEMSDAGNYNDGIDITVDLQDIATGQIVKKQIKMTASSNNYRDNLNWDIYSENTNSGIPILINRSLSETDADSTNKLNEFVATGSKLRSNPIQIIDLRWNIGGNDGYAKQWVQNYTGISPANPFFWTTLLSDTALDINNNGGGNSPMPGTQWANILSPTQKPIPNNNLLIVLTDGQCCSAGESFVGYLRQIDNVIFVGVPTMGCLLCGNVGSTILPESKLSIRFGVNLSVLPDLSVFEGNGFAPDLWVPPGESLDHVIKFIEQYGYN